jgi:hypothetical protein
MTHAAALRAAVTYPPGRDHPTAAGADEAAARACRRARAGEFDPLDENLRQRFSSTQHIDKLMF